LETDCFADWRKGRSATPIALGRLPHVTTHKIHNEWNGCHNHYFDYYLFVVRDPLARIQSWFTYERPPTIKQQKSRTADRIPDQARLFVDCPFSTLNELAMYGLDLDDAHDEIFGDFVQELIPSADEQTVLDKLTVGRRGQNLCQDRAHWAIRGLVGYAVHNRYSYQYYLQQVEMYHHSDTNVSIAVLRTEHLQRDWQRMEEIVSSSSSSGLSDDHHRNNNKNVTFARKNNASTKNDADLFLSDVAIQRLCYALCEEIQTYKQLLRRAVNLAVSDVAVSLQELAKSCPVEAAAEACPRDLAADKDNNTNDDPPPHDGGV
jgi:hypothetical protein